MMHQNPQPAAFTSDPQMHPQIPPNIALIDNFKNIRDLTHFFNYPPMLEERQQATKKEWEHFAPSRDKTCLVDTRLLSTHCILPKLDVARLDSKSKMDATKDLY